MQSLCLYFYTVYSWEFDKSLTRFCYSPDVRVEVAIVSVAPGNIMNIDVTQTSYLFLSRIATLFRDSPVKC